MIKVQVKNWWGHILLKRGSGIEGNNKYFLQIKNGEWLGWKKFKRDSISEQTKVRLSKQGKYIAICSSRQSNFRHYLQLHRQCIAMEICFHESIISSGFLFTALLQILKAIQSFLQLPIAVIIQYTHSYLWHSPLLIFSVSFSIISSMRLFAYYINYKGEVEGGLSSYWSVEKLDFRWIYVSLVTCLLRSFFKRDIVYCSN